MVVTEILFGKVSYSYVVFGFGFCNIMCNFHLTVYVAVNKE